MSVVCAWIVAAALAADPQPAAEAKSIPVKSPVSPDDSLQLFVLDKGLRIELVAAEPQIVDPVAARFDEDGRLWVVEMRDYPHPPAAGEKPKSRIKLLEDRDGDGRYETSHVFADELLFATGVQPWKGGVIATVSGAIIYLKDTDGDHRADVRETWFTGFTEENPQLRVNHPRFALDNWVYVASGLRGGMVKSMRRPFDSPISLRNRDLRFDPRGDRVEAVAGNGQFGVAFDDFGRRFICSNRNPCMHVVLEDRYLSRNPLLAIPAVTHDVAAAGEASRVFPLTEAWTTSNLHAGQFTAACGLDIYRGDALPAEYRNCCYTCEPTGNLVHREIMAPLGATFTARPAADGAEFLASRDGWCRPVNIDGGPDGALYVVDMYRAVIEHPQFMPAELKERPDLWLGNDRGRIYRIVPADWKKPFPKLQLSQAPSAELVKLFESDNAWHRETAQRLIYERRDKSVQPQLEALAKSGARPTARAHALWTLQGLDLCDENLLLAVLRESPAPVREQALLLAEPRLKDSASLQQAVDHAGSDADARVRFQAALCLGEINQQGQASARLGYIALKDPGDLWLRRAIGTAAGERPDLLLSLALQRFAPHPALADAERALLQELAALVGSTRDPRLIDAAFAGLGRVRPETAKIDPVADGISLSVVAALAQGLKSRGQRLTDFVRQAASQRETLMEASIFWLSHAAEIAQDRQADAALRKDACDLLAYLDFDKAGPVLTRLIESDPSQEIRQRAVAALAAHRDPSVGKLFLENLTRQTPSLRAAMLDAILSQADRINLLLDDIEAGRLKPTALDSQRATRLIKHASAAIRERAAKLLAAALPADRTQALADYRPCLDLKADPQRGREVFKKNCTTCHKIGDLGVDVGPSIADTRTKTLEQLLIDIIQPSKAIDNNFMSYTVVTSDGVTFTGIIVAETANSVTLKGQEAKTMSLLRDNIEELRSNGVSLMPEGLEKQIPLQDMADLLSFLKNWRYLGGAVPVALPGAAPPPAGP